MGWENPSITTRRCADIEVELHILLQLKPALLWPDENGFLLIFFIAETEKKAGVKTDINIEIGISWADLTGIKNTNRMAEISMI